MKDIMQKPRERLASMTLEELLKLLASAPATLEVRGELLAFQKQLREWTEELLEYIGHMNQIEAENMMGCRVCFSYRFTQKRVQTWTDSGNQNEEYVPGLGTMLREGDPVSQAWQLKKTFEHDPNFAFRPVIAEQLKEMGCTEGDIQRYHAGPDTVSPE